MDSKEAIKPKIKKPITKTEKIVRKTLFSAIILIVMATSLSIFSGKIMDQIRESKKSRSILENTNKSIQTQIAELNTKSATARKYVTMWNEELTAGQKTRNGMSIERAREAINIAAERNRIDLTNMQFSSPIQIYGSLSRSNVKVFSSIITLSFGAMTDINVHHFIDDLEKNIEGFMLVQELSLRRTRKIDEEFIKSLEAGTFLPTLKADLKIRWYALESIEK